MIRRSLYLMSIAALMALLSCQSKKDELKKAIISELGKQEGEYAVAFKDMSTGEEIVINERESFHAASTMKTPVMIEVFKQIKEGALSLGDSILIKNEFKSIVDGSPYNLTQADDSEPGIYSMLGKKMRLTDVVYRMITSSSNLATNILIELVDAKKVTQTMRDLGAKDIQILRGVEDSKAFENGLSNSTTAYDLMIIFEKLANGSAVDAESSKAMVAILSEQKYNDIIPARLPKGVTVAHKTGWLKGLNHDSAIVYLPNGTNYVLVLLSRNATDVKKSKDAMAIVSEMIYQFEVSK